MTKKEKRSVVLQIRLTPSEAEKIYSWVDASGMELPDYLRRVIMQGVTFRIEVSNPEILHVESGSLRLGMSDELKEQQKERKHGTSG